VKPRNTWILLGVVLVAAGLLYLDETRWSVARSDAEAAKKAVFPGLKADDVKSIEILTESGEAARLERRAGGWRMLAPVDFPADRSAVDAIASGLADLESEAVYDSPEDLAEYGLAGKPVVRFRVGDKKRALRIGDKTPVGSNTYVTDALGKHVFAVQTWRTNPMRKKLDALRDARVLVFDRAGVERIEASWPGGHVVLQKGEKGKQAGKSEEGAEEGKDSQAWSLLEPLQGPADVDTVEGLLSDLTFLRAEHFVDEPPDAKATAGLETPAFQVALHSGDKSVAKLVVGASVDGKERLVRGRDGILYWIAQARVDDLPRKIASYCFRELSRFTSTDAQRFTLAFQAPGEASPTRLTGTHTEVGWSVSPEAMAPGKASRFISELSTLKAVDIAADALGPTELAGLGLSPPRLSIQVQGVKGKVLADVQIGDLQAGRGIAARRAGSELVYWLDGKLAEHLPVSLEAYRNRFASKDSKAGASPAGIAPKATTQQEPRPPASP